MFSYAQELVQSCSASTTGTTNFCLINGCHKSVNKMKLRGFKRMVIFFIPFIFLIAFMPTGLAQNPVIKYAQGITNDRELCSCEPNMACNLIHRRFIFTNVVMKLCRCPDKSDCPQNWHEKENYTLYINPRAQLKFCDKVTTLPTCSSKMDALTSKVEKSDVETHLVAAMCYCPKMRYFDRSDRVVGEQGNMTVTTQTYKCKKMEKCHIGQFCGHITSDYFQTYNVCSCPKNNMCQVNKRDKYNVIEALFEGEAYRGECRQKK